MIELDLFWSLFIFTRLTKYNRVQEKQLRKYKFVPGTVYLSRILSLTAVTRNHSLNSLLIFAARNSLGQVERPQYKTVAGVPGLVFVVVNCKLCALRSADRMRMIRREQPRTCLRTPRLRMRSCLSSQFNPSSFQWEYTCRFQLKVLFCCRFDEFIPIVLLFLPYYGG